MKAKPKNSSRVPAKVTPSENDLIADRTSSFLGGGKSPPTKEQMSTNHKSSHSNSKKKEKTEEKENNENNKNGAFRKSDGKGKSSSVAKKDMSRGGKNSKRRPRSLPPIKKKLTSSCQPSSSQVAVVGEKEPSMHRFIGSPPPSALRGSKSTADISIIEYAQTIEPAERETSEQLEERTVYEPKEIDLELTQPRIVLKSVGRCATPSPSAPNFSSSALTLRSLSSAASAKSCTSLNNTLTPPPKLISYHVDSGAEAVQEWMPDRPLSQRRASTPSIKDFPSPLMGGHPLSQTPKIRNGKKKYKKLSPLRKK